MKNFALLFLATATAEAMAHEGHGLAGSAHWHATDTLGFVGVALVALVVWSINKRK